MLYTTGPCKCALPSQESQVWVLMSAAQALDVCAHWSAWVEDTRKLLPVGLVAWLHLLAQSCYVLGFC